MPVTPVQTSTHVLQHVGVLQLYTGLHVEPCSLAAQEYSLAVKGLCRLNLLDLLCVLPQELLAQLAPLVQQEPQELQVWLAGICCKKGRGLGFPTP